MKTADLAVIYRRIVRTESEGVRLLRALAESDREFQRNAQPWFDAYPSTPSGGDLQP